MAQKKKLLVCLLAVALLLAGVLALGKMLSRPEEEPGEIQFLQMGTPVRITIAEGGDSITLTRQEGKWLDQADPEYPIRQTIPGYMVQMAADAKAARLLDRPAETGLDERALTVTLEGEQETVVFSLGSRNPATEQYYAQLGDNIYMVEESLYTAFHYDKQALYAPQALFAGLEDGLTGLEFQWDEGSLTLEKQGEDWALAQPPGQEISQTAVASLIAKLGYTKTKMTVTAPDSLAPYGLEKPWGKVLLKGETPLEFLLGQATEEGIWVRREGEAGIHLLATEDVGQWVTMAREILEEP